MEVPTHVIDKNNFNIVPDINERLIQLSNGNILLYTDPCLRLSMTLYLVKFEIERSIIYKNDQT